MGTLNITLLDGVEARDSAGAPIDLPGKKAAALLAILALNPGRAYARESLVGLLWSDRADSQARASLRQVLAALRKALAGLDPSPLRADGDVLSLDADGVSVDAVEFQAAVSEGSLEGLSRAVALYGRDLLSGLTVRDAAFEDWLDGERARLHTLALDGLAKLVNLHAASGDLESAIEMARRLIALDSLREEAHRSLIHFLAQPGDRAGALKQFEICRSVLMKELGVDPDAETKALAAAIRDGEVVAPLSPSADIGETSPETEESAAAPAATLRAIAVLPFKNLAGDAASESFVDSFTEEVILGLSRFRYQPVIASQSVFAYKGKAVNVQEVARALGAGFVVEGTVRSEGDRLRVSTQLVAATDGHQVWSQSYERSADDLFATRDAIATQIVAELGTLDMGQLSRAMLHQARHRSAETRSAHDYMLLALEKQDRFTRDENEVSKDLVEKALEIDPDYAMPIGNYGWNFLNEWMFGWGDDFEASRKRAIELAGRSLALEPSNPDIHWTRAAIALNAEFDFDLAEAEFRRALDLNPNSADIMADWGGTLAYLGQPQEAREIVLRAMALNPVHPDWYKECLGIVAFSLGEDKEVVEAFRRLTEAGPYSLIFLAAAYARLGQTKAAREIVARLRGAYPDLALDHWVNRQPYKNEADRALLRDVLGKI